MALPQIKLSPEKRAELGRTYLGKVLNVKTGRSQIEETWRKSVEQYEGKVVEETFPWLGAANTWLPIISTHTDAIYSRLMNTAMGQDPVFLVLPWSPGAESFSRATQKFSQYLESERIDVHSILETALMIMCKYGDSIVYIPWERRPRKFVDYDDEGNEVEVTEDLLDQPVPKVLHPEDFFIPVHEQDIQEAEWVAFRFAAHPDLIRMYARIGFYDKKEVDALLTPDEPAPPMSKSNDELTMNDIQQTREQEAGLSRVDPPPDFQIYNIWARLDIDDDGIEEEVNLHVEHASGRILRISHNPYRHRKRPFVHFRYVRRDGIFYSIGVPEMLSNIQDLLNKTMRQIMDNNTVKNTKIFLARAGGPIKPGTRLYPSRILFVKDVKNDFSAVDLGSGNINTSVQDIQVMQQWGERRTGITDFNLGQERSGRTPATTTLALLQEANKRLDLVVRNLRHSMEEMWSQVLQLYAQFRSSGELFTLLGPDGQLIESTWEAASPEMIRKKLLIRSQVSTQNLNRSIQKQENIALLGLVQQYYQQVLQAVQLRAQVQDPAMQEILTKMLRGGHQIFGRILDSFDVKDQGDLNPDVESAGRGINEPGQPIEAGGGSLEGIIGSIRDVGGGAGPINPPGRPIPGIPRLPGSSPASPGQA